MKKKFGLILLLAAVSAVAQSQDTSGSGTPVRMVVTIEAHKEKAPPPAVEKIDLIVKEGRQRRTVSDFKPLADAPTQLLLLIDDSARWTFGTEIQTLRQFVQNLPPNFDVGIGYMRNGMTQFTHEFTRDHAAAAATIRLPQGPGGGDVSPYDSLTDAIKKWPTPHADRREVLMISSGAEGLGGGYDTDNPYVNAGIDSAVKAGIPVFSIYNPSVGHMGHSMWGLSWGQNFLSLMADHTGGELYDIGFGSAVTFQPFLDSFMAAQRSQYLVTFLAEPVHKGAFRDVHVDIEGKDVTAISPTRVWVPAEN